MARGAAGRLLAEHARRDGIDRPSQIRLGFSFIHRRVSRWIDDYLRLDLGQQLTDCVRIGQIALLMIYRHHLAQRRHGTLQFKANLAVATCQKDFHDQALYCLPTQFW